MIIIVAHSNLHSNHHRCHIVIFNTRCCIRHIDQFQASTYSIEYYTRTGSSLPAGNQRATGCAPLRVPLARHWLHLTACATSAYFEIACTTACATGNQRATGAPLAAPQAEGPTAAPGAERGPHCLYHLCGILTILGPVHFQLPSNHAGSQWPQRQGGTPPCATGCTPPGGAPPCATGGAPPCATGCIAFCDWSGAGF